MPAPTITSTDPTFSPPTGGKTILINGADFVSGATVTFDGIPATGVTWISAAQLSVVTPAHAIGGADIVVTNPDLQTGLWANSFDYTSLQLTFGNNDILRWDGATNWLYEGIEISAGYVWASAENDAWAVRNSTVWRHNGISWSSSVVGTVIWQGLHGTATNDVWMIGWQDDIFDVRHFYVNHWDGATWTVTEPGATEIQHSIWASAANDVWMSGAAGTRLHYDGATWTDFTDAAVTNFACMWGSAPNNVWFGGKGLTFNGWVTHWNGASFDNSQSLGDGEVVAIWGSAANDVWFLLNLDGATDIIHWNGSTFVTATGLGPAFDGISVGGTSSSNVWVSSSQGMKHWDGVSWSVQAMPFVGAVGHIWCLLDPVIPPTPIISDPHFNPGWN
jgi:hypothetical protein